MAEIYNTNSNTLLSGTSGKDTIENGREDEERGGDYVTILGGGDDDVIYNEHGSNVKIDGGSGNDFIGNYGDYDSADVKIDGGSGDDSVCNEGYNATIDGGTGNDSICNYDIAYAATINGGSGNDYIENAANGVKIYGGSGNDEIDNDGDNVTINGGEGKDTIFLSAYYGSQSNNVLIQYASGDGNDLIQGFDSNDTLQISGNSYSTQKSGENIIVTVGDGKISLLSAASLSAAKIVTVNGGSSGGDDGGDDETNSWKLNGTTATYGTSSKTLVTVKGVKSVDGLSLSGKVVTVANSSLNNSKVTISNGYTLKLADDVSASTTKKAAWSYANSTATYKGASKTAGYSLASDGKSISYTKATSAKTLAKITGAKSKSGLSLSGKKITLKNSALTKKVTVSGSYEFDFAAGYKNATISGTAKADSITARGSNLKIFGGKGKDSIKMVGSNQTVSGGAGADTFIYAASGGKERITDFSTNDTLKIGVSGNGTYSTATSGSDVIVSTDDGGKITLVGAAGQSLNIAGTINDNQNSSGKGVKVSGRKITLTSAFEDSSFSLSGKYSSAVTLDASAALLDLSLTGNAFANRIIGSTQSDTIDGGAGSDTIYGGDGKDSISGDKGDDQLHGGNGNDTLWGGAGDDELYGDAGADVFYYKTGEGSDTIYGYEASVDKIILASGKISNVATDRNNNVIFVIGDGQLVINNAVDRTVKIVNSSGKIVDNGLWEP